MPPKQSNLHHVTFHLYRSAILLSLPSNTSISSIKTALLPALSPLASSLSNPIPKSTSDIKLFEKPIPVEGQETNANGSANEDLITIDDEGSEGGKTIAQLGWGRWKTLYISFRDTNGEFGQPTYTIPNAEDDEVEADGAE